MFNAERFYFKILSVLSMTFPPSTRYSPSRAYNVLVFRRYGNAQLVHNQETYHLTANNVSFIPKGMDYTITTATEEDVIVIHFDADIENGKNFLNLSVQRPEQLFSLFEKSLVAWSHKPIGYVYKLDALFSSILEYLERQSAENYANLLELTLQRTIDEMNIQLCNPELSIEKLAAYAGYTPSYFRRAFRQLTGKSPIEYLTDARIEHATSLLESGYYTVEHIASLCGFSSSKYFSSFYKAHTGVSPSKVIPKIKK